MPVKIRLMRIGAKKRPFYRVVAVDEREKRTGKYLELLGTYNPLTEPKEVILKKERLDWWKNHGAVESDGFLRATGKAAPRPPRKLKKEHKEEAAPQTQPEALKPEQPVEEKPEKKLEAEPVKEQVAEESPAAEETPMENSESSQEASAEETKPESEENQN